MKKETLLTDLHIHSTFSDGVMTIPEIVDFYGIRGFGAIAITDHLCETGTFLGTAAHYLNRTLTPFHFPLYREILRSEAERARDQYDMVVIPGFELTKNFISNSRSAHLLALGVEEYVSANSEPHALATQIRNLGGLTIAAHPVHTRIREKQTYLLWDQREELSEVFDAWEVASGRHLFPEVLKSGLPMIANSDLHRPSQVSSWKTIIESEKHPLAILDAIKKQDVRFYFYNDDRSNPYHDNAGWIRTRGPSSLFDLAQPEKIHAAASA